MTCRGSLCFFQDLFLNPEISGDSFVVELGWLQDIHLIWLASLCISLIPSWYLLDISLISPWYGLCQRLSSWYPHYKGTRQEGEVGFLLFDSQFVTYRRSPADSLQISHWERQQLEAAEEEAGNEWCIKWLQLKHSGVQQIISQFLIISWKQRSHFKGKPPVDRYAPNRTRHSPTHEGITGVYFGCWRASFTSIIVT